MARYLRSPVHTALSKKKKKKKKNKNDKSTVFLIKNNKKMSRNYM